MKRWTPWEVDGVWDDLTEEESWQLWNFVSSELFYRSKDTHQLTFDQLCDRLTEMMENRSV